MFHIEAIKEVKASTAEAILKEYMFDTHPKVCKKYNLDYDVNEMYTSDLTDVSKYQSPHGLFLAAYDGDTPVGIGAFSQLESTKAEIKRFYVKEAYRRKGVASAILKEIIDRATEMGYLTLYLESSRFMTEAHQLYRKFGFRETTLYSGACSKPGYEFAILFMEKSLC